jgi:uncharacterized protein involved in exopolysaccharide biosynthesis
MSSEKRREWEEGEVDLLEYWRVLVKRRYMILGLLLVSVCTTGIDCSLVKPKIFESTVAILGPKESGGGSAASLVTTLIGSGAAQALGGILSSGSTSRDTFVAILKSRTIRQDLAERFQLRQHYGVPNDATAAARLQGATTVLVSKEGVISVKVEDQDSELAAAIANAYATHLDRLFAKLGIADASRQRVFLADRLEKTEKALRQAEEAFRKYQESNKVIAVREQSKSAIEAAAGIKGQLAAAEVQLEVLRLSATETNPQVIQQKRQIDELKRQLAQTQYGRGIDLPAEGPNPGQTRREFHVPFAKVPELEMEFLRLTREVKVQEAVFATLTQSYEQAKIAEARDTPVVQLLDKAIPGEQPSKPRTRLNMAIAGALSLSLGVLLALFLDYLDRIGRRKREAISAAL